jgi:hypothetical protein
MILFFLSLFFPFYFLILLDFFFFLDFIVTNKHMCAMHASLPNLKYRSPLFDVPSS